MSLTETAPQTEPQTPSPADQPRESAAAERAACAPRIVVVGGGAGGLELATRLGHKLGRRGHAEITLVDASLTHLWKPLLHEVASGTLDSQDDEVSFLAHAKRHHFRFQLGTMAGLNRERRRLILAPIEDEDGHIMIPGRELPYDKLVIAIGSMTNSFGVEGVKEHCLFLDSRNQADRFQHIFLSNFIKAQTQAQPPEEGQMRVAIIGGGATGVELAAELHHVSRRLVAYGFDRIVPERDLKLVLIEAADRLVPAVSERISGVTERELRRIGVDVHTGTLVTRITREGVETKDGLCIPARFKVWTAGIKAPPFLSTLGLTTNRINQIVVRPTLQTQDDDTIFAIGDCAACPSGVGKTILPPTAQAAHQQALLLARSLTGMVRKEAAPQAFQFVNLGGFVSLGGHTATGALMGNLLGKVAATLIIEGWLARFTYRLLYRKHQWAIHGALRTTLMVLTDWATRSGRSRLKLH